jgi:biopolymer transport protein TolQ
MDSQAMGALQQVGQQINVSGTVSASAPHHMSMFDLFLSAEPTVKFIMFGLIIASIWSWAIILFKLARVYRANRAATSFEEAFWSGGSLDDLYDRIHTKATDPMSAIFCAAMREWRRSVSKGTIRGTLEQRIDRVMQVTLGREMEDLEKRMTFLASLGSNGMIVGLFGTVIGIMNSFESIAAQQNTNLAVVAPGIAEALFATAIGLVAAIPAAIAYNKISSDLNRFANRLDTFCAEFGSIVSRQLEEA